MKKTIEQLIAGEHLSRTLAHEQLLRLAREEHAPEQQAAFLIAMQAKGLQLDELQGFQDALLELCTPLDFGTKHYIDVCGTGGDGKDTFNISTTTAFVLASMGFPVVKHGNYGVSSLCGSSNVLEYLGVSFTDNTDDLKRQLEAHNLVFLHAPLFHPALKKIAPVRLALGMATFFNELGPLVNPARPAFQLTGTYRLGLARFYQHILAKQRDAFYVLHGLNGYDELTFDGATRIFGKQEDFVLQAAPNGIQVQSADFSGGDISTSAYTLVTILSGKGNATQNAIVAGNVALGIRCFQPHLSYQSAFEQAHEHVLSGTSIHLLNALRS